jgi:hypothetical protein
MVDRGSTPTSLNAAITGLEVLLQYPLRAARHAARALLGIGCATLPRGMSSEPARDAAGRLRATIVTRGRVQI